MLEAENTWEPIARHEDRFSAPEECVGNDCGSRSPPVAGRADPGGGGQLVNWDSAKSENKAGFVMFSFILPHLA